MVVQRQVVIIICDSFKDISIYFYDNKNVTDDGSRWVIYSKLNTFKYIYIL